MVLGQRTKTQRSLAVNLDYIIHIQDIKPWPPSQSLSSLRSVLIQWKHGDKAFGSTNQVVPSLGTGSGVCDGRIEFNESIRLSATLVRELLSVNGVYGDTFQKNYIEFNLYEPRQDKTMKSRLLGTAVLDLADHGVVRENLSIGVPVSCKRSHIKNMVQPLLYLDIQSVERRRSSSSLRDRLIGEASMDRNYSESISGLMNEEYEEESNERPSSSVLSREPDKKSERDVKVQPSYTVEDSSISTVKVSPAESIMQSSYTKFGFFLSHPQDGDDDNDDYENALSLDSDNSLLSERTNYTQDGITDDETREKLDKHSHEINKVESKGQEVEVELLRRSSQNDVLKQITSENNIFPSSGDDDDDMSKHPNSVRLSPPDSSSSNGSIKSNQFIVADIQSNGRGSLSNERKDPSFHIKETQNQLLKSKIKRLEDRVKVLEGELKEAAGIEISLYSVIAEHGSSMTKVHAPARRLSRFYFHASKQGSISSRANAAKSTVSRLVLVAKACGNDVPRLTFWLSNSIVLRVIMTKSFSSSNTRNAIEENSCDWENPLTFTVALEKVEKWIFSRIVESLWWQIFTPHMQSGAAKVIRESIMDTESRKLCRSNSTVQQPGSYSIELWKKAFRDASERICPVRAQGHDCGCIPIASRLIMEQLIARLDVAMFNAILRESVDELPTDPLADPISDAEVRPIQPGKASFGTGAQLKNAIGNWCLWLTDPGNGSNVGRNDDNDDKDDDTSSKCFHLLSALSDLMMLPKDLLLSRTIRKEVCPTFGPPLIRRVLNSFVPDEFCPDPIPEVVIEALNSEDPYDDDYDEDTIMIFPCAAPPTTYHTPSASSVASIIGDIDSSDSKLLKRSGSSVLKKSQTSDDELDELDSPLSYIIPDPFFRSSEDAESCNSAVRYQLLRKAWMNSER